MEAGHELGNHSMTHQYENKAGIQGICIDIIRADRIIQKYQPNHLVNWCYLFSPLGKLTLNVNSGG